MKIFIGVDIGLTGAITAVSEDGKVYMCMMMPTIETIVNKKKKNNYDLFTINSLLKSLSESHVCHGIIERLRPIPNQSSQTGFSLGYGSAVFESLFTCHGVRYEKVEPAKWQKDSFKGYNYTKDQTKIVSIQVAKTLSPETSLLPTERCKKPSDGKADSICMAYYLLRENSRYEKDNRD